MRKKTIKDWKCPACSRYNGSFWTLPSGHYYGMVPSVYYNEFEYRFHKKYKHWKNKDSGNRWTECPRCSPLHDALRNIGDFLDILMNTRKVAVITYESNDNLKFSEDITTIRYKYTKKYGLKNIENLERGNNPLKIQKLKVKKSKITIPSINKYLVKAIEYINKMDIPIKDGDMVYFDYPDYWGLPKSITKHLSSDEVDQLQESIFDATRIIEK